MDEVGKQTPGSRANAKRKAQETNSTFGFAIAFSGSLLSLCLSHSLCLLLLLLLAERVSNLGATVQGHGNEATGTTMEE